MDRGRFRAGIPSFFTPPHTISSGRMASAPAGSRKRAKAGSIRRTERPSRRGIPPWVVSPRARRRTRPSSGNYPPSFSPERPSRQATTSSGARRGRREEEGVHERREGGIGPPSADPGPGGGAGGLFVSEETPEERACLGRRHLARRAKQRTGREEQADEPGRETAGRHFSARVSGAGRARPGKSRRACARRALALARLRGSRRSEPR